MQPTRAPPGARRAAVRISWDRSPWKGEVPWVPLRRPFAIALHRTGLGGLIGHRHPRRDRLDHRGGDRAPSRRAPPEDVDRAVAAARAAFPAWAATPVEERTALLTKVQEAPGRPHGRAGRPDHPRGGHAPGALAAGPGGPPDDDLRLDGPGGEGLHLGAEGGQLPGGPRAGRRGGRHHPLELPAAPDRRQGGPGPDRRLHGGAEAQRGRPPERLRPGRGHRRGRYPGRGVQPGDRARSGGRRGHRRPPGRRHGVLHRARPGPASG